MVDSGVEERDGMEQQKTSLNLTKDRKELEIRGTPMFPCEAYTGDVRNYISGEIPWHWHEELEAVYILNGRMRVGVDSGSFTLEKGEGLLINSGALHSGRAAMEGECRYNSFVFHESLISGSAESVLGRRYVRPFTSRREIPGVYLKKDGGWREEAAGCILKAYQAYEKGGFGFEFPVREQLSHMWYLMVTHMENGLMREPVKESLEAARIKTMISYIQEHFKENLELRDIAQSASIGERECLRCFKKSLGIPPIQYLLKYRVTAAAALLKETGLSVTEVGNRTGFDSPSYFTMIFKRFMGCTPTRYRRQ